MNKLMRRVFLDVDGVLADFDGGFELKFGARPEDVPKVEMWKAIKSDEDFFSTLPKMKDANKLYNMISSEWGFGELYILTSAGSSDFFTIAEQKKAWIKEHIDPTAMVLVVRDGLDKSAFVQYEGDILIDDHGKNIVAWERNGGTGILHRDVDATLELFYDALDLSAEAA